MSVSRYEEFAEEFRVITGKPMETGSLSDRITIQKIAYLLFRKRSSAIYTDFSWYLHGVFSWDLWRDIINSWDVSPKAIPHNRRIELNAIRMEFERAGLSKYFHDSSDLELVTTILRCATKQADLRENNSDLIMRVMDLKSKFSEKRIRTAIGPLKNVNWKFA